MVEETFDIFGNNFQTRVLQGVLMDNKFFQLMYNSLRDEYFTTDAHQAIWGEIKNFYDKYKSTPTFDNLKIEFATWKGEEKENINRVIYDIEHKVNVKESEQVRDKAKKFCRNKRMEFAVIQSAEMVNKGVYDESKYDEISNIIEKALKESIELELGHNYFGDLNSRMVKNIRKTIPSGFPVLDSKNILDGGFGSGELVVVMAPTGGGKSFFLVNFGYGALMSGHDVVHYTFELSETNIGWRYDSRITGIPIKEIVNNIDSVESVLKTFSGGKLIIKEYPTRRATVNDIKFHYQHLCASGYNPKLMIIDYADLMRSRKGYEQKRFELECIYEDLRGLAMELGIPIVTASQINRLGYGGDIITIDKVGESMAKVQIADFIASFSRGEEDKKKGTGKFYIAKNRNGEDGFWLPTVINMSISKIEISRRLEEDEEDDSSDSRDVIKKLFDKRKDRKGI